MPGSKAIDVDMVKDIHPRRLTAGSLQLAACGLKVDNPPRQGPGNTSKTVSIL